MIEMELVGVRVEMPSSSPIALLREVGGSRRVLPIFIGAPEATAIAFALEEVVTQRPMTHDLLRDVIQALDGTVDKVVVCDLKKNTFYALIHLTVRGEPVTIDSRPSDAIALAVRSDAPIFADDSVIEESAIEFEHEDDVNEEQMVEEFKKFLDDVKPEDFSAET